MVRPLFLMVLLSLIPLLSSCMFGFDDSLGKAIGGAIVKGIPSSIEMTRLCQIFYNSEGHWPSDSAELLKWMDVRKIQSSCSRDVIESASFERQENGGLLLKFSPDGPQGGSVSGTVTPPSNSSCKDVTADFPFPFPLTDDGLKRTFEMRAKDAFEKALVDGTKMNYLSLRSAASAWASSDMEAAEKWCGELPSGKPELWVKAGLILAKASKTPEVAAKEAMSISDTEVRENVLGSIACDWSQNDPVAAAAWVDRLQGKPHETGIMLVADYCARKDPEAAAAWSDRASNEYTRSWALCNVVSEWAQSDIDSARELSMRITDAGASKHAFGTVAFFWAKKDSDAATKWALTLPEDARFEALRLVARSFGDRSSVEAWIETLPVSEEMKSRLKSGFDKP